MTKDYKDSLIVIVKLWEGARVQGGEGGLNRGSDVHAMVTVTGN